MTADSLTPRPSPLLAWLRLFRIPNVFTALADVLMGFAIVHQSFQPWQPLVALLIASACLYTAGMVLNDVFDVEQDTRERPQRPIPAGRISLATARAVGFGLLIVGIASGAAAGFLPGAEAIHPWRTGAVAVAVAACVLLYDVMLKKTLVGPVFMGLCRFYNVLLGASLASSPEDLSARAWGLYFTDGQLLVAGAICVYVIGITLFARTEATQSQQARLTQGLIVMIFGIAMLLWVPRYVDQARNIELREAWIWPTLLAILGFSSLRHALNAIVDPQPAQVQYAVKSAILAIITLDAAVTVYAAGPVYALVVFVLVVPAMLLGRAVYST